MNERCGRIRKMRPWEAALAMPCPPVSCCALEDGDGDGGGARWTPSVLAELFGRDGAGEASQGGRVPARDRSFPRPPAQGGWGEPGTFTLRLEHRSGGELARYRGEERILMFRSGRAGAVAKVIYSSEGGSIGQERPPSDGRHEDRGEQVLRRMAQARIHVLDVNEAYQGLGLGGLLFNEALRSLRDRYHGRGIGRYDRFDPIPSSVRCQLEAEEDICRHNKLVGFYERLGCSVKTQAKIQYINNNDGETYRKVPMQIVLEPVASRACPDAGSKQGGKAVAEHKWACQSYSSTVAVMHGGDGRQCHVHKRHRIGLSPSLVDLPVEFGFLPVRLLSSVNTLAIASSCGDEDSAPSPNSWILAADGRGFVQFRTTGGGRLVVTCDGGVRVLGGEEDYVECDAVRGSGILDSIQCDDNMCYFSLRRIPDGHDYVTDSDESEMDAAAAAPPQSAPRCSKDLWVLQNARGRFLTTDPLTHQLICTSAPSFWQADRKHRNLVCTTDTPPRRIHYRNAWLRQTVMRVGEMRAHFLRFRLRRMTMRKALHDMAASLPLDPFLVNGAGIDAAKNYRSPCLRTFSYFFAEMLRKSGYPDWMQLAALIHEIGRVVYFLDTESAAEAEKEGYDWTVSCRSRVVGCRAPARASFDEFRSLCPDETDDRYRSALGMYEEGCGLANVWLAWTGPEYVYHMLRHNGAVLPEEGMAILRLFPLGDWHCYGECGHLANEDDEDLREWVAEFDELRRRARRECTSIQREDLSDADCRRLWETSYAPIAAKYGCDHTFSW